MKLEERIQSDKQRKKQTHRQETRRDLQVSVTTFQPFDSAHSYQDQTKAGEKEAPVSECHNFAAIQLKKQSPRQDTGRRE